MKNSFFENFAQQLVAPSRLTRAGLLGLLWPLDRTPQLRRHAAAVILARVQLISTLFALLVPLWSVVDLWVFPANDAVRLVALRFASAAVFVALAWPRPLSPLRPYTHALAMLTVMLLVPPVFYLISLMILDTPPQTDLQRLVMQLYAFMPTIVLGGLAIFPLTAVETLALALPVFTAALVGMSFGGIELSLEVHGGTLWFMAMMMGVAMFSGMSQMHYMETLVHKAMTDPLTGAYSRRSGVEALELQLRLAALGSKPLTIAFFDIDHFKSVNDDFGHDTGDRVLREFVEVLRNGLRRGDILIRWGGEEFLVLLPEMPVDQVVPVLERLRTGGFGVRPDGQPITASIGIAEQLADHCTRWQELVEIADARMYEAKHEGRDRAVLPNNGRLVFADAPPSGEA